MNLTVFDILRQRRDTAWREAHLADATRTVAFSALEGLVRKRAVGFQRAGLKAGDRVLVAQPNSVDWVLSALAIMRIGGIAAPINPDSTVREIEVYKSVVKPAAILAKDGAGAETLRWQEPDDDPGDGALPRLPAADDPALILFTSGTTGHPKAALQPHRTLVYSGEGIASWLQLDSSDRLLLCMPLFHANGIYYSLMGGLSAGASIFIAPSFSVSRFWQTVRAAGATEVNLMGPMIAMLQRAPEQPDDRDNSLRLVYTAAVRQDVAEAFSRRFDVEIVEGYGLTETPFGCINPCGSPRVGSIGRPRQHPAGAFENKVCIADEQGRTLEPGQVGEIMIRNPATFTEYWGNPEATRAAFRDGWLRTGDIGYRDEDDYFFIVGRAKEIVRRKGVNIAPAEIELVLASNPDIQDAALIGLPSALGEELAIAVVTLAAGASREGAEIRAMTHLRSLVSREKVPDRIVVVDRMPKTATERIAKTKLKEWLQVDGTLNRDPERR
jgi:crotonobetaine/carnitine-CoA ligase